MGDKLAQAPSLTPQLLNIQYRSVPVPYSKTFVWVNNSSLLLSRGRSGLQPGLGPSSLPPSARFTPLPYLLRELALLIRNVSYPQGVLWQGNGGSGGLTCLHLAAGRVPDTWLCVICCGTAAPWHLPLPVREAFNPERGLGCFSPPYAPSALACPVGCVCIYGSYCVLGTGLSAANRMITFNARKWAPVMGPVLGLAACTVTF